MPRTLLLTFLVVTAAAIPGCSRRDRGELLRAPISPARPAEVAKTAVPGQGTPAALPVEAMPLQLATALEFEAVSPTEAAEPSPDVLWNELEDALDELDLALAGVETWEVEVP